MPVVKKYAAKTLAGLLIFAAFFTILSPFYVYRSVTLKLRYFSTADVEISIAGARYPVDVFTKKFDKKEFFSLTGSNKPSTAYLEIPTDNHIGGFQLQAAQTIRPLRIVGAAFINRGKEYPFDIARSTVDHESRDRVVKKADSLTLRPGNNTAVYFAYEDYMPIRRSFDPLMAFYCILIALMPAMLVFFKFDVQNSLKNIGQLVYVTAAIVMLISPILLIDYYGVISKEKRLLNPFPEVLAHRRFNLDFPRQFEAWFSDRFSGRGAAIKNERDIFNPRFLGKGNSNSSRAFYGKENWMFSGRQQCVEMFQNQNRFTEDQLKSCAQNVTALEQYCAKHNIKLYLMLTPDRERVYSECYPDRYRPVHPESRLEQLHRYLTEHTSVKIIFPLYEMRKARNEHLLYYKTGSHWTPRGAYIAADMLLKELKKDFPELPADQPNAQTWTTSFSADVDIAHQLGYADPLKQLPKEMLKHDVPVIRSGYYLKDLLSPSWMHAFSLCRYAASTPQKNSIKMFAGTDSFWSFLMPFLFPATDEMLHAYYGNGISFELYPHRENLEEFKPDVMVIETTERFLDRFLTISMDGE